MGRGRISLIPVPSVGGKLTSGTYTGNGTANRAIAHSLGTTPKLVIIIADVNGDGSTIYYSYIKSTSSTTINYLQAISPASIQTVTCTALDATNWYTGNGASNGTNESGGSYTWYAAG